jgi:hypothetical protein
MTLALHYLAGLALFAAGWGLPRRVAGARRMTGPLCLALDAGVLVAAGLLVFLAGGRPVLAGAVDLALGAGFALADQTTREALREPVLFSALSEVPQLFTHPQLYLPFAGTGLVLGGLAAVVAVGGLLLLLEPAAITPRPVTAAVAVLLAAGGVAAVMREPLLGIAARLLRGLEPSGEPFADAAALGPMAMLFTHGIVARSERPARRAALVSSARADGPEAAARPRPVILVQCESFFDARRVLPVLPAGFLPGYDAASAGAAQFGRLAVPAWGANTTRAEFAVLTGIDEPALGLDRFNPYHAFARVPLGSQVWRLRAAGYRTICLHPFDRRFFRRDLVMPALGFERFLGRETLGGSRAPPYATDPDLAGSILRVLDAEGPRTFIFVVTMGNHGPWFAEGPSLDPAVRGLFDPGRVPQGGALLRYLDGLRRSDELLRRLVVGLRQRNSDALLGWYGDHLPSLPRALAHFGVEDWASDYAVWSALPGNPLSRDLAAVDLGRLMVDRVLAPHRNASLKGADLGSAAATMPGRVADRGKCS